MTRDGTTRDLSTAADFNPAVEMSGASLIRGGAWQLLSYVLPQTYTFIISIVAARYLGPDLLGRQSFVAFVALTVNLLLTGGLSVALMRGVAETLGRREPAAARGLVAWAWRVSTVTSVLGGAGLAVVALLGVSLPTAWVLAGVGTFVGILFAVPSALLVGAQRFREAAVIGLVGGTLAVPAIVAVLAAGGGVAGMFAVEAVVATMNLAWASSIARRTLDGLTSERRSSPELERATVRYAIANSVTVVLTIVVWRRSEFFFLAHYSSNTQLALYSIAFAAVAALAGAPEKLSAVLTTAFAALMGAGADERMGQAFGRALRLFILLALPLTAGAAALGPGFVTLVYGREFSDVGPVLLILLVGVPIVPLWNVAGSAMAGLGRASAQVLSGAFAAVVNVGLALALIPRLDAVGAALANLGGQLAATLVLLPLAYRAVGAPLWRPGSLGRCTAVAALAGLIAWSVDTVLDGVPGILLGSLAFAGSFAGLAIASRILTMDDARWLEQQLGHRLGGWFGRGLRLLARPAPVTNRV